MPESEETVRHIARRLPKVQLHLHLDGSLPEAFLAARAAASASVLPAPPAELRAHLLSLKTASQQAGAYTQARGKNWHVFDFCNAFLQTRDALHDAAYDVVAALTRQNVWLVELRFCPFLHVAGGLTPHDAVAAVVDGFRAAARGARGGVILCALRSFPASHVSATARLAASWRARGVVGMDLAGDEASYPLALHAEPLAAAARAGVNVTVHAGEWGSRGPENVATALEIGVRRIGHGLAIREREALCHKLGDVFVEVCLTANCTGGEKVPADRFDLHPVKWMLDRGVRVAGFNCDNLLLSGTLRNRPDPTEEVVRARMGCGLSWEQIGRVLVDGVRASFDDSVFVDDGGETFLARFEQAVENVLRDVKEG